MSKQSPDLRYDLMTPFTPEKSVEGWEAYPRPQFKRDSYLSLCGPWELSVRKNGTETPLGTIQVPFAPESVLSGIFRTLEAGETYVYRCRFTLPEDFGEGRTMLNFGAVDQIARVSLNGTFLAKHEGGYLPFTVELTDVMLPQDNLLEVEVTDELDLDFPHGKQRRKRGGMWYTPISGIWQVVWLECVPETYIERLRITPTLTDVTIEVIGGAPEKTLVINTPSGPITRTFTGSSITVEIPDPIHWTPKAPHLYYFSVTAGEDTISSYFALRTITIESHGGQAYICLNGEPTFFHGLLDQGYFSDGIYTPYTPEGYLSDILTIRQLGFNMIRKHIKIEPDLFYYYCDKYGMVIFQDMVNSGAYNFVLDTALPTVGLRRGVTHFASKRRRRIFEETAKETIAHLYNHPSVCYYTIFNEGWGQYDADRLYREFKALDPSRVWDATSGWFFGRESDVRSEHVYFKKIKLKPSPKRPLVLSEFGGYALKIPHHAFNPDKTYGYKLFRNTLEFSTALSDLYETEIQPMIDRGLNAAVLTQLSDVEDETNGLMTYDRQITKISDLTMKRIAKELYAKFDAHIRQE